MPNNFIQSVWRALWLGLAMLVLVNCGGGGSGVAAGAGSGSTPSTNFGSSGSTALSTPDGNTYYGIATVGDVVKVALDPAKNVYRLTVLKTQWGASLTSDYTGTYTVTGNVYKDTVNSSVSFIVSNGNLSGLFKIPVTGGQTVPFVVIASNNATSKSADLAGTYNFMYSSVSVVGTGVDAHAGQAIFDGNGALVLCPDSTASSNCVSYSTPGTISGTATFNASLGGLWDAKLVTDPSKGLQPQGSFSVNNNNGQTNIAWDFSYNSSVCNGCTTDTTVVVASKVQAVSAGTYDGTWSCLQSSPTATNTFNTGNTAVTVSGTGFSAVGKSGKTVTSTLSLNQAWVITSSAPTTATLPSQIAMNGFMSGTLGNPGTYINLLPVNTNLMYALFYDGSNGTLLQGTPGNINQNYNFAVCKK